MIRIPGCYMAYIFTKNIAEKGMTYYELYPVMKIPLGFGMLAMAIRDLAETLKRVLRRIGE
ncbi:hypothetical protein EV211_10272 [Aminicella lysinilytica]|uniref:Uncharacterized protein n=1 Tax=Aminicella lysinilytica TaxID=433323 RepID=A0A4R6QC48_9FIRM|nr:hypothetical protein EV211_10272 [Aminicella lysinilytica]